MPQLSWCQSLPQSTLLLSLIVSLSYPPCCIVHKLERCMACGAGNESDCPPAVSLACQWEGIKDIPCRAGNSRQHWSG